MPISKQLFSNNAKAVLNTAVSSTDLSLTLDSGSKFPVPSAGQFFLVTLEYSGNIEVVKVTGKSGNILTGCVRAQEGTTAQGFPTGTRVECRVTSGTLSTFAKLTERLDEIASVDLLDPPNQSNSNSYVCSSTDEVGNPTLAIKNSTNTWRLTNFGTVKVSGVITAATNYSATGNAIGSNITAVTPGKYIIQFVTGANIGLCRAITASNTNVVSWSTSMNTVPAVGDQFEIYKSSSSSINELVASIGTPPSDPTKADANNPVLTGLINANGVLQVRTSTDVKANITANTATTTINLATASVFKVLIAANTTFDFVGAPGGTNVFSFTILTLNDATAGRAVAFPGNVTYAGGTTVPPRTTAANGRDVWTFFTEDAGVSWVGSLAVNAY